MSKRLSLSKKIAFALLSVAFAFCAAFGVMSIKTAKADESIREFSMIDGASLRIGTEHYGLRFAANVPTDYDSEKEYRMLIVPADYLETYGVEKGDDYYTKIRTGLNEAGYTSQELLVTLPMEPIEWVNESDAYFTKGETYFFGSITDIAYKNIDRDFFGIAFYEEVPGEYVYASFNDGKNVASAFYVASNFAEAYTGTSAENVNALITQGMNYKNGVAEANKNQEFELNVAISGLDKLGASDKTAQYTTDFEINAYAYWDTSDHSVATIDSNGLLTVVNGGNVDVEFHTLGRTFTKTIEINNKQEVSMSKIYGLKQTDDTNAVITPDFKVEVEGALVSAKVNGAEATASQDGKVVTIPSSLFTASASSTTSVVIITDSHKYTISLKVANFLVTKAYDLTGGRTAPSPVMKALTTRTSSNGRCFEWKGYVLLASDIDFGGAAVYFGGCANGYDSSSTNYGFTGTIDGNGYALKNFTFGGSGGGWGTMFGYMKDGTIKNLSILNAKQQFVNNEGLLHRYATGTISNCYFDIEAAGTGSGWILGREEKDNKLVIKDTVIIVRTGARDTSKSALMEAYNSNQISNTVVFSDYAEPAGLGAIGYESNKQVVNVISGNDAVVEVANATRVLKDGKDITDDITITASSVTIPSSLVDANSTYVVIGATSKIVNIAVVKQEVSMSKTYGLKQTNDAGEIINPDFTVEVEGTLESATINGVATEPSQDGNVITIPSSLFTASASSTTSVVIVTDSHKYTISVKVANFLVTKASDLSSGAYDKPSTMMKALTTKSYSGKLYFDWGGYVLLASDIDFNGASVFFGGVSMSKDDSSRNYGFTGTIDGNGYALKNFTFGGSGNGWTAMFGHFKNGTIKNLLILNAKQQFRYNDGLLHAATAGTIENCYFDIEAAGNGGGYILGAGDEVTKYGTTTNYNLTINNSVIIVRTTDARDTSKSALIGTYTSNKISNTVVFSDYAEAEGLKTALGDKFVGYAESKLEVSATAGDDAVVEVANATKVLKDGKDITSLVTIGDNVTIPSDLVDANSTYVVIGATSKIVNLVIA